MVNNKGSNGNSGNRKDYDPDRYYSPVRRQVIRVLAQDYKALWIYLYVVDLIVEYGVNCIPVNLHELSWYFEMPIRTIRDKVDKLTERNLIAFVGRGRDKIKYYRVISADGLDKFKCTRKRCQHCTKTSRKKPCESTTLQSEAYMRAAQRPAIESAGTGVPKRTKELRSDNKGRASSDADNLARRQSRKSSNDAQPLKKRIKEPLNSNSLTVQGPVKDEECKTLSDEELIRFRDAGIYPELRGLEGEELREAVDRMAWQ